MKCSFLVLFLLLAVPAALAHAPRASGEFDFGDDASAWVDGVQARDLALFERLGASVDGVFGSRARVYVPASGLLQEIVDLGYRVTPIPGVAEDDPGWLVGYHTHAELTAELQAVALSRPDLCRLYSLGTSVQGRALWIMKISDNVALQEDEPEFQYVSTMHGNEPVGMELCLNLVHLLVDQYGIDPRITNLVDELEIWILPLMNPDGYANQSRYNAHGIDLNRDFPDRITNPDNTTAGRAVETQLVMNWAFGQSTTLSANFHTGALVVNYPFDSDPDPYTPYSASPDDPLFVQQSLTYSALNGPMYGSPWFPQGITNGAAWYVIHGGMQDWKYVWMGCNDVTIELSDVSWPAFSQIPALWNDNRDAMLAYMETSFWGVRGVVADCTSGQPVAATVRVAGIDHDVYTDPDVGDYHRLLLAGTYDLEFSAAGYDTQVHPGVVVGSGVTTRLDVAMHPAGTVVTYCTGKTSSLGCVPFLSSTGTPSVSATLPFRVTANDLVPGEAGFYLYGVNGRLNLNFHGGKLCVKAPFARLLPAKVATSSLPPPCQGRIVTNFNNRIQSGSDPVLTAGQCVTMQLRQRHPGDPAGFGDSLTDGIDFIICD